MDEKCWDWIKILSIIITNELNKSNEMILGGNKLNS